MPMRRWAIQLVVCVWVFGVLTGPAFAQLPSPWTNRDIGSPAVAGSAAESAGTFTVRGAGSDIWYATDQFHLVSQPISGDVDIRAQVTAVQYINQWTKAGVMVRETLAATSRHASTFVTPGKGLAFQRRVSTGGQSTHTAGAFATAPYWVRLVRAGQLFTSYVSADGASWQLVGSETITMAAAVQVGLAVTSHDSSRSAMATFTNVTVNGPAGTPPPPTSAWLNRDIGSPALAGRSSESNGTFSVTGGGSDIWGTRDQFQFMYQQASGDVEVVARLNQIGYAHAWSKGGVMIRESLSDSAAHAFMAGTAGKGWAFQRRSASGGDSVHSPGSPTTAPGWVRLVRLGDLFTAYESTNGVDWEIVGTETIPMPSSVYIGLAVTSHEPSLTSTATFTNVRIQRAATPTNSSPSITLLAPADGTTYSAPGSVTLSASASVSNGTIVKVGFYANGDIVATDTTSPFTVNWGPVPAGTYNLHAVATDDKGGTATSGTVTITVSNSANQPPTAAITSPANGASFVAPANITINASASDSNGSVTRVDFLRGSTLIGSDTAAPYSVTWSSVPAGTYSLTAVAYDNGGASTASAAVTISVTTTSTTTPTTVLFVPSLDHATVTSYSVAIYRASDLVTATPAASKSLGKPSPVNNEISANISDIVNPLAAGSYYAVVTAIGSGGSARSTPSATFTK